MMGITDKVLEASLYVGKLIFNAFVFRNLHPQMLVEKLSKIQILNAIKLLPRENLLFSELLLTTINLTILMGHTNINIICLWNVTTAAQAYILLH